MAQCSAKAKSTGEQCKRYAVKGYSVCQVHGAGSPNKGKSGGRPVETGKWSKRLPARLAQRFDEYVSDPRLLFLDDEIGLVDSRTFEVIGLLHYDGGDKITWELMIEAIAEMELALEQNEATKFKKHAKELRKIAVRGNNEWVLWREIAEMTDLRRKLVESERKHRVENQQMVTLEEMMRVLLLCRTLVFEFIVSDEDRNKFRHQFGLLLGAGTE